MQGSSCVRYLLQDPAFENFIARVPPAIAATLTEAQLIGLQKAFLTRQGSHHSIDIRLSVPLPGLRFYLVFLAGPERRSPQRLRQDRRYKPLWTPTNVALMAAFFSWVLIFFFNVMSGLFVVSPDIAPSEPQSTEINELL